MAWHEFTVWIEADSQNDAKRALDEATWVAAYDWDGELDD